MPVTTPGTNYIYRGHKAAVTTLAWSPDGRYLASGSVDKTVQVWQIINGALHYTFVGHTSPITALAWNKEGINIASAGDQDGKVLVWNAFRGKQATGPTGQHGKVLSLTWQNLHFISTTTPDSIIFSSADDGTVQIWDARNEKSIYNNTGYGIIRTLLFYAPGSLLLAGDKHIISYWQIARDENDLSQQPDYYNGHTGTINALAWIVEHNTFASASNDGTVRVWSTKFPPSSASPITTYRGHKGSVYAIAAYQGLIISAGQDQGVQIWRFDTGRLLYTYTGHRAPIRALAMIPQWVNGAHTSTAIPFVASASDDGTVHVWRIPEKVLSATPIPLP
ncbi:hypothetical protein KDW_46620 [Dictyobacter vulcani]|uniref:Uncharacterized protein n=1 Tax=Dictyobacter vulcani TaxID=2607529 RepID=A0A5J4KVG2_9CHLR|nr:WD40 repeat domain-containing protein [Dictyobacter vulcani]GER90500.1 hypothetical protein KDW_46620 [Dictyobacter vulcani]